MVAPSTMLYMAGHSTPCHATTWSLGPMTPYSVVLVLALGAGLTAADIPLVPHLAASPTIDGIHDDACWGQARVLQPFGIPLTVGAPAKQIEARCGYDAEALYIAITCTEPEPAKFMRRAKAHGGEVWRDDCVGIFLRTTGDSNDVDHLIVSASGPRMNPAPAQADA